MISSKTKDGKRVVPHIGNWHVIFPCCTIELSFGPGRLQSNGKQNTHTELSFFVFVGLRQIALHNWRQSTGERSNHSDEDGESRIVEEKILVGLLTGGQLMGGGG